MRRDAIDFGSDNIPKLFGKMLMPTLLGMLCMSVMTVIDGVFIGHGVGSDALAAVNIFSPFWLLMTAIGMMLGIGCSVVSSIHLSQDNVKAARINMTQTLIFGVALALIRATVPFARTNSMSSGRTVFSIQKLTSCGVLKSNSMPASGAMAVRYINPFSRLSSSAATSTVKL